MIGRRQVIAIIFAGGAGKRLQESCADNFVQNLPKQFLDVNGCPILIHTLNIFQQNDKVDKIYIATHKDYDEYTRELVEKHNITKIAGITIGADTALGSQYNALKMAEQENPANSIVLIHDGVRPNVSQKTLANVINGNIIVITIIRRFIFIPPQLFAAYVLRPSSRHCGVSRHYAPAKLVS